MLDPAIFGNALIHHGINFFAGVPCPFLKYFINYISHETQYLIASNEGDAIATCAGAYLGGKTPAVIFHNAGLGNAISPLTTLAHPFKLPILGIMSLRGEPAIKDDPQHQLIGKITTSLLDSMRIPWAYLSSDATAALQQIELAMATINKKQSFFLIVKNGTFSEYLMPPKAREHRKIFTPTPEFEFPDAVQLPGIDDILQSILARKDNQTVVVTTTGHTSKALFALRDSPTHFYQIGAMGCVGALGLGVSLSKPNKKVIVIDGDGSVLMRLGTLPTIGHYGKKNICHILLDNGHYASSGHLPSVSRTVDFGGIATASGYRNVYNSDTVAFFDKTLSHWVTHQGLTFIRQFTSPAYNGKLARIPLSPDDQVHRFKSFVSPPM